MSNLFENRVSQRFTPEELEQAAALFASLTELYKPKTIALNKEELKTLRSLRVSNFVFVQETITTLDETGLNLLPPAIAGLTGELRKDADLFEQLGKHKAVLQDMLNRVTHTMRLVGHESYKVSNSIYDQYQLQAGDGVPGAAARYEKLKKRYSKTGVGRPKLKK